MKADNKDPYDIKKFEEVLGESRMMVPDSQNRYKKSLEELKEFMNTNEEELTNTEWIATANGLLEAL